MVMRKAPPRFKGPVLYGLMYCVLSALWIALTDKLVAQLHLPRQTVVQLSIAKGFLYVIVSGALIYAILKRLQEVNDNLESTVAARTAALEQKKEALKEQADILRTFIDCAPVGLAMFDRNMCYIDVSKRWCKEYGLDRASILGKSQYSVFPDLPERWKEIHRRGLRGEVSRSEQDSFTDQNGKEHWLRWEVRPWGDADTGAGGIIIFTEDVTQQHLLESQLLQAQKMEAIGVLAGGVAHDFNNLLMVIRTRTELIERSAADPETVVSHAHRVPEASDRAASLTAQLLAFSRKQPQQLAYVDINSVVTTVCKMLPTLVGEDIELTVTPMATPGVVHADPFQLEHVIMNLVVNARDAMPHGGRLLIETSLAELDEEVCRRHGAQVPSGRYVGLSVTDTGCGMDQQTRDRIFDPFFTTKAVGKGTGLGLSMVYGIVKQSEGFVWVYSEVGQGTTFRIYLPQSQSLPSPAPIQDVPSSPVRGTATILLVEDEPGLREVMCEYLQTCGYDILSAEDGKSALQMAEARKDPIHILLTDIGMPGMRGTALAPKIIQIHPEAKVIWMSGYPGDVLDDLPNASFMQKPVDLRLLVARIQNLLNLS